MNITLMAHDKKKELMVQFCTAYRSILAKHSLSATAATGRLVADATGLPVSLVLSKNQGGHQQIDARIAYNEIDLVFMFSDPSDADPWEDQRIIRTLRLCDTYNVPCATNLASAEMLILCSAGWPGPPPPPWRSGTPGPPLLRRAFSGPAPGSQAPSISPWPGG